MPPWKLSQTPPPLLRSVHFFSLPTPKSLCTSNVECVCHKWSLDKKAAIKRHHQIVPSITHEENYTMWCMHIYISMMCKSVFLEPRGPLWAGRRQWRDVIVPICSHVCFLEYALFKAACTIGPYYSTDAQLTIRFDGATNSCIIMYRVSLCESICAYMYITVCSHA